MSQTVNLGHVVGPGVPNGGTAGQVLKKNSGTNFDTSWGDNNATTIPMSGSDNTSIGNAMSKILPVITGTTNNSGYAIAAGEYFEANGGLYQATASIPVDNAWSSSATALTDHGAVNALNSNKANYLFIDATSYTHNSKTGWDFAYGQIPNEYNGILRINFSGGYNIICTAYKQNSNWGSIIGHENSDHIPFFYNVQNGTSTLDGLALNSKIKTETYDTGVLDGNSSMTETAITGAMLEAYKTITLCLLVGNATNRVVASVSFPSVYLKNNPDIQIEASYTNDGTLVAIAKYYQAEDKVKYNTGNGAWKCRIILSK